jgi:hypothetical protein
VVVHPSLQSLISMVVTGIGSNESFIFTPEMHILLFASGNKVVCFRKPSKNTKSQWKRQILAICCSSACRPPGRYFTEPSHLRKSTSVPLSQHVPRLSSHFSLVHTRLKNLSYFLLQGFCCKSYAQLWSRDASLHINNRSTWHFYILFCGSFPLLVVGSWVIFRTTLCL